MSTIVSQELARSRDHGWSHPNERARPAHGAVTGNSTVSRGWLPCAIGGRRGAGAIAALIGGCGAFLLWQSLLLDIGDAALPGPGFFPLLLAATLLAIGLLLGIECWRSATREAVEIGHRDVLISIAILLLVPVLFEPAGAPMTLGLFAVGSLVLIGRVAPLAAIAATGLGMAACWYFFEVLLGVQLPRGPL